MQKECIQKNASRYIYFFAQEVRILGRREFGNVNSGDDSVFQYLIKREVKKFCPTYFHTEEREALERQRIYCHIRMLNSVCFLLGSKINKNCLIRVVFENGIRCMNGTSISKEVIQCSFSEGIGKLRVKDYVLVSQGEAGVQKD